ncbi:MAG: lamin tail domain-containing protein [Candidatus Promineifilaceae bacterium]
MMMKKLFVPVLIGLLLLAGCDTEKPTPTPEEPPTPTTEVMEEPTAEPTEVVNEAPEVMGEGVFISELLTGVPGGNNQEFIELYNAGSEAVDLDGWSLWYLLGEGQTETVVFEWNGRNDIPPHGHFLLIRAERDFGIIADGIFDVALSEFKGGLVLKDDSDEVVDALGWGDDAPAEYTMGSPATLPESGSSLVRLPGGEQGSGQNTGDNSADFVADANPTPQNSGSPAQPAIASSLVVQMKFPEAVAPGTRFDYTVEVTNLSDIAVTDVVVIAPVPPGFTVVGGSGNDLLEMPLGNIPNGGKVTGSVAMDSPFTYSELVVRGYYAQTPDGTRVYGGPQILTVSGGAIPIATARQLVGSTVTVEGVATMYTGGFFAGSTSVKFYIQDETGGIQIFADGGAGIVEVDVGDRVRVTGSIAPYRDSLELIPGNPSTDVEIIGTEEPPEPSMIAIPDNESDDSLLGRLNVIEGVAVSIEEMSFDYDVELADDQGNSTLVLIEKDTGVTSESMDVGQRYRVVGISEFYQGEKQVKPRYQSDIVQVFPPILRLELSGKNNALPGETLPYTITVYNHTTDPMTNVLLTAPLPTGGATPVEVADGGVIERDTITWEIGELAADGGSMAVHFTAVLDEDSSGIVQFGPLSATADQWPDATTTEPYLTFAGSGVPVWAIQGTGLASPYARSEATTEGVVTAVFPDLDGFFIQDVESDGDPATSDGLFVLIDNLNIEVAQGDLVQVSGKVQELFTQTTLHVEDRDGVVVLESEQPLPAPAIIDPPQENEAADLYDETLEGMLVTLGEPAVAVAPTTQYGEYVLVYQRWGVEHVARTEPSGFFIMVDDGMDVVHENQGTLPYAITTGDIVTNLTGPLAFSFGHYKIEPIATPDVTVVERPLPSFPMDGPDTFTVATFNVENLFDLVDPHPSSPPRPTLDEYRLKLTKIAEAIVAMGAPDIIGLQEVENIGILEDLVEEEQIADFGYVPYLIEGDDSRGIDVAYLVRSDQVTVEGINSYPGPDSLTVRHPLVITATVHLESGDKTVIALNNHFLAMSAGEAVTEPTRTAQAAWNAELVERFRAQNPDASIIVMGDLNSFFGTPPIETLQAADLRHVYEFFGEDEPLPYTYIFEGATQSLDHILLSEDLFGGLVSVQPLHISADYPIWSLDDATAQHLSDHDPLVIVMSFD